MPSFSTVATFALVASASLVSAAPIACRGKPDNYVDGYLEDYDVYHARYIALECSAQHNSTFFDDCCHPLLANETLTEHRPAYCTPQNATLSSVTATLINYTATATASVSATASADVQAFSEYSAAESTATSSASSEATVAAVADYAHGKHKSASATSSSTEAAWTAAPTSAAAETSSEAAAATTQASSSGSGQTMTGGYATYFYQGGNAGACGTVHSDSDKVIAIDTNGWWQDTSSASPYCGKWITITNTNNGKTVNAMVADACPTCVSDNSLDLSVGAFTAIADESDGQVPITWQWA